ncbi:MAG: hypothetical protein KU28_00340 [Sulfurovum sp. PC08-66]|nr:MAG: hypothetical protein KU28_00340 [Sulfurovum sp. PC08-66]KIM12419.1 MAG: hypothetical protein KU37_00460 [Sulfuricurvum sp. PC08-66]
MKHKINYAFFYLFTLLIIALPAFVRRSFFRGLGRLWYALDKKRVRVVLANLTLAFGDTMPLSQKYAIARGCFENLFLEMLSVIETHFLPIERIAKTLHFVGLEHIEAAHVLGKPIVFFTAHYNDLEIGGIALGLATQTVHSVQKATNPYIDAFISKGRQKVGLVMVPMHQAMRNQARQLKNGGDVSIVVDQSVDGTTVEFFGHPTKHTISASKLTRNYDAILMPTLLLKTAQGAWQPTFFAPIPFTKTDDEEIDIAYLTQAQASFIEAQIRANPAPWFWCHRRWRDTYPKMYA